MTVLIDSFADPMRAARRAHRNHRGSRRAGLVHLAGHRSGRAHRSGDGRDRDVRRPGRPARRPGQHRPGRGRADVVHLSRGGSRRPHRPGCRRSRRVHDGDRRARSGQPGRRSRPAPTGASGAACAPRTGSRPSTRSPPTRPRPPASSRIRTSTCPRRSSRPPTAASGSPTPASRASARSTRVRTTRHRPCGSCIRPACAPRGPGPPTVRPALAHDPRPGRHRSLRPADPLGSWRQLLRPGRARVGAGRRRARARRPHLVPRLGWRRDRAARPGRAGSGGDDDPARRPARRQRAVRPEARPGRHPVVHQPGAFRRSGGCG